MSRIGKKIIIIPDGVTVKVVKQEVSIKGSKGKLGLVLPVGFQIEVKGQEMRLLPPAEETKRTSSLWGTSRALLANMITGVVQGFQKQLEIEGVGYTAGLEGRDLVLKLGLSHPVKVPLPPGIEAKVEKNLITIFGIDKAMVGQVAADIRAKKKPEPYKGKGIHYLGEIIRRKAGKKAVSTTE